MKKILFLSFVKKYLLIFSFLLFLPLPVLAEKKYTLTQSELTNTYMEGFYSGIIMQACTLQREGIINEEEKLNLIEFKVNLIEFHLHEISFNELKMVSNVNSR